MAGRRRPSKARPRSPARVRTKKKQRKAGKGRAHPPGSSGSGWSRCRGLFLSAVVAPRLGRRHRRLERERLARPRDRGRRHVLPVALVAVGALMVGRSPRRPASVPDRPRPFCGGLVLLLGDERGGASGPRSTRSSGRCSARPGRSSSAAFLPRRASCSSRAPRWARSPALSRRGRRPERGRRAPRPRAPRAPVRQPGTTAPFFDDEPHAPPVDGEQAYPDVVHETPMAPVASLVDQLEDDPTGESDRGLTLRRRPARARRTTASRTPRSCASPARASQPAQAAERTPRRSSALAPRRRGHRGRPGLGAARDALRAPARAGDEGREGLER